MDKELYPVLDYLKQMYGYSIDPQGIEMLTKNKKAVLDLFYNGNYGFGDFYDELSKRYPIERFTDYYDELTPTQQRVYNGGKALTDFNAHPTQPMKNPARLTKFENPTSLKPLAGNITKNTMRGAAHLVPIVGAGLTAADIYQGLNQPVAAGTLDWNQMTPQQQQKRIEGYQQVQDIIDNIQARQRVQQQYNQNQADMIRRARFGI